MSKARVVLDTNVIVSGLLVGRSTEIIRRWKSGDFEIVLSPAIIQEYEAVLNRPKFRLPDWVIQEFLNFIRKGAVWATPNEPTESFTRDPSDEKFLAAAAAGQAEWLVSGDKDLLDIEKVGDVSIISPSEFLQILGRMES